MLLNLQNDCNHAGCLQSVYSLYTFKVESIASGKPAPLDELQFHGVHNPDLLKTVINCNL